MTITNLKIPPYITPFADKKSRGIKIFILASPRASKNELIGTHDDRLKVRLTSPPVDNKANTLLVDFLSKLLNVKKRSIRIIDGLKSRKKTTIVEGLSPEEATLLIEENLPKL
ncbi:MAG: DUF167 domain-containing protein [Deltaproteobacteria bacterium]|nr:DUF167 domain-containing protein [Deltaproteobacteria bacterium]